MGYGDHIRGRVLLWFPSVHRASPTVHNIAIILKVAAIFAGHLNKRKESRFRGFWNCNSDIYGSVRVFTVKPGQAYPPRFHNKFIIRKWNLLVVVDFRFISAFLMSREFTREAVTKFLPAKFPWIWCKCLSKKLTSFKDFLVRLTCQDCKVMVLKLVPVGFV